jgi:hypothetical protein
MIDCYMSEVIHLIFTKAKSLPASKTFAKPMCYLSNQKTQMNFILTIHIAKTSMLSYIFIVLFLK